MDLLSVAKKRLTGRTFGARLRAAREAARGGEGMTQQALADACDIHRIDVTRYENDKIVPSLAVAWRLADALGVSLDDLRGELKGEGEPEDG
jgi:transcriptional regulator with XRE-family HTH domain